MRCGPVLLWAAVLLVASSWMPEGRASQWQAADEVRTPDTSRVRGIRDNKDVDVVLGGLFPIRSVRAGTIQCGDIRAERSVERMEAMLYAIDVINNSTALLPDLTVGFDIRDTCGSETVGTEEALDIILSGGVLRSVGLESDCPSSVVGTTSDNSTRNTAPVGVVGAASSGVSQSVASLLRLFNMPQISYSSTSTDLSDAERYDFFHRTISPDNLQTSAMVDFLVRMNWTYVVTIHSEDTYGSTGIESFTSLAEKHSICIERNWHFPDTAVNATYAEIAQVLVDNTTANVIVLFTLDTFAQRLIEQVHRIVASQEPKDRQQLMWIASDAWARSSVIQTQYASTVAGYIGFLPFTDPDQGFHEYFSSLNPSTNVRNRGIFTDFYRSVCGVNCTTEALPDSLPGYSQGTFIPLVIDAVFAFAHAVQLYLDAHCPSSPGAVQWDREGQTCVGANTSLSTTLIRDLLLNNVSFNSSTGFLVEFDAAGNVEIPYRLINFQANRSGGVDSELVFSQANIGVWYPRRQQTGILTLDIDSIQYGLGPSGREIRRVPVESSCSEECGGGEVRQFQPDNCCWTCKPCRGQNFSSAASVSECSVCPQKMWGDSPFAGSRQCVSIPVRQLAPADPIAIVAMALSGLALIAVGVVILIFVINYKHAAIKSSGREQVSMLLIGITLSFCLSFIIVPPPSIPICLFQRLFIWASFALIYGALLVKIIRVYRIFNRGPTAARPRFTKPHHQILFTLLIVAVQLVITLASLITSPPTPQEELQRADADFSTPTLIISCQQINNVFFVAQLLYDAILILLCTFFGWKTRNFPENFNEAKYVLFTSLALILVWLGFIPTYIVSPVEYRYIAINFPILLSSMAVLIIFFIPKIYFIYARRSGEEGQGENPDGSNYLTKHIDLSKWTTSGQHEKPPLGTGTGMGTGGSSSDAGLSTIRMDRSMQVISGSRDGEEESQNGTGSFARVPAATANSTNSTNDTSGTSGTNGTNGTGVDKGDPAAYIHTDL